MTLEHYVEKAILGDKIALESVIKGIQNDVYYLSLRMLANLEDAKDATQEIMIRVVTKLSMFNNKSKFKTWVFRVAYNYLISYKIKLEKEYQLTFTIYKEDLQSDLVSGFKLEDDAQHKAIIDELRISCTIAMLLCLTPSLRMAFVLGEIFEFEHQEASEVLEVSKEAYRKQLSRARTKLVDFMNDSCGLVNNNAKCSCEKKLYGALQRKRIDKNNMHFTQQNNDSYAKLQNTLKETQINLKAITSQCSIVQYNSPIKLEKILIDLLD